MILHPAHLNTETQESGMVLLEEEVSQVDGDWSVVAVLMWTPR